MAFLSAQALIWDRVQLLVTEAFAVNGTARMQVRCPLAATCWCLHAQRLPPARGWCSPSRSSVQEQLQLGERGSLENGSWDAAQAIPASSPTSLDLVPWSDLWGGWAMWSDSGVPVHTLPIWGAREGTHDAASAGRLQGTRRRAGQDRGGKWVFGLMVPA